MTQAEKKLPDGLEEAAKEAAVEVYTYTFQNVEDLIGLFKAGAKWMKAKMMEEAMECTVMDFSSNLPRPQVDIRLDPGKYHTGDKVRIIVIKED